MSKTTAQAKEPIALPDRVLSAAGLAPVLVRELSSKDRERLLAHFLSLDEDDRLLRFGQFVPDHVVENYVRTLDFERDRVFGVFNRELALVGVAHLAYLPSEAGERTAELGVSVLESARGQGIGTKLFERAATRSRNTHVTTLYMHCLSRNRTMMHIARKAGMRIERAYGEADAYLTLAPADQSSILKEMLEEQAAAFDYALKRQAQQTSTLLESLLPAELAA
ncbi:GNAT family N-acetyltransferase [Paraburkholderia sp. SOS3]|jgi:RimJ/RimL family protein N-acetyltransferase|uniref:GNAT family N-acetyltransferase n=1 Tax=Paraburkholderia sp. SOS3 TaxID=1926494 RepID=UPI0009475ABE|nr:GNAT family N-acetyltransferase [Paraburkholderia sp. SOS3]APR37190.1 GNAT family N-acetyltransferase [Paraburkholderia sp. SOS3]